MSREPIKCGDVFGTAVVIGIYEHMDSNGKSVRHYRTECSVCSYKHSKNAGELRRFSRVKGVPTQVFMVCGRCGGLRQGEVGLKELLATYKKNAEIANREFSLTTEEFKELTSGLCHYCGRGPSCAVPRPRVGKRKAKTDWGRYLFNGIDRVDNKIGYVVGNVLSCCKRCNFAKGEMTYDEFIEYIRDLATNFNNGKIQRLEPKRC